MCIVNTCYEIILQCLSLLLLLICVGMDVSYVYYSSKNIQLMWKICLHSFKQSITRAFVLCNM